MLHISSFFILSLIVYYTPSSFLRSRSPCDLRIFHCFSCCMLPSCIVFDFDINFSQDPSIALPYAFAFVAQFSSFNLKSVNEAKVVLISTVDCWTIDHCFFAITWCLLCMLIILLFTSLICLFYHYYRFFFSFHIRRRSTPKERITVSKQRPYRKEAEQTKRRRGKLRKRAEEWNEQVKRETFHTFAFDAYTNRCLFFFFGNI